MSLPTVITTETECALVMERLRVIKARVSRLQAQLTAQRTQQKELTQLVGGFLAATNRTQVQMGDLLVRAQTTTIAPRVNILTSRATTARQVLAELATVGVNITPVQWGTLVQSMRQRNVRTRHDVQLTLTT